MRARAEAAQFDHLVVAAATLADGVEYIAGLTGARAVPGGTHASMGTHNALLRLGPRVYLEIIAIDPAAPKPERPRFFDLDDAALAASLPHGPRLVHWVARAADIGALAAGCPIELGRITPMARGAYRWTITIRDDGSRPGAGIVPTLIQWQGGAHPADALPESGIAIAQLAAAHPDPESIRAALGSLGLGSAIATTYDRTPRLAAMLRTPRGLVTL